jgi:ketosteroid isomerase-like protein
MRNSVLGLVALFAATVISSADGAEASDATMSGAQREVLRVEREWSDAEIKHDVAALRLILDDRFIATFGAEASLNKEQFIKAIGGETMISQEPSEATVIVDGNVAVVVDTFTTRGTENGQPYTRIYRITSTYIKRHGRWAALAEQIAPRTP